MELSLEDKVLLQVLKDYIHNQKTYLSSNVLSNINWSSFATRAQQHMVGAIVFKQIEDYLKDQSDSEVYDLIQLNFLAQMFASANRKKILHEIDSKLTAAKIPYILFKGTELSQYYPHPQLRSMGDSDVLVHKKDKETVHNIFLNMDFENINLGDEEWRYYKNSISFELHHSLLYEYVTNYPQHHEYCDQVWKRAAAQEKSTRRKLDLNFVVVYLFLHLRKHILFTGTGFKQFLDLAVLTRFATVDWDMASKDLNQLGILPFSCICMSFCEKWFNVKSPLESYELDEEFFLEATNTIAHNGVFGFNNPENMKNHNLNEIRTEKGKARKAKIVLRRLFPPYEYYCNYAPFPYAKDRKWLLPAAWFYRLIYQASRGNALSATEQVVKPLFMEEDFKSREAMLKKWGID